MRSSIAKISDPKGGASAPPREREVLKAALVVGLGGAVASGVRLIEIWLLRNCAAD